jgi:RNA polymerase sigma-70 factor (ECF subfamily)
MVAPNAGEHVREVVARQRDHLVALIRRQVGDAVDADEIVQAAVVRALTHADQLRATDRVEAWLSRIARNAAMDELRQRRGVPVPIDEVELADDDQEPASCWCVPAQAAQLKAEYAQILRLVDMEGMAVKEAAGVLQVSPNNAMVRLHRARKALRARMAEHCGTTSIQSCAECGCEQRGCCG